MEEQNPRTKAARDQQKRYQGKECALGHGTERYTINGQCVSCVAVGAKRRREQLRALLGVS